MHLGDRFHQRQADAQAARQRLGKVVAAVDEQVENVRLEFRRDAFSLILDAHRDDLALLLGA